MKRLRNMISLVIAMVMAFTTTSTVYAQSFGSDAGKIAITSTSQAASDKTTTYEAYRIFDVVGSEKTTDDGKYVGVTYTIAPKWVNFFGTGGAGASYIVDSQPSGKNYPQVLIEGVIKYIAIDGNDNGQVVNAFAKAAFEYAQATETVIAPDYTITDGSAVFEGIKLGYYMVYPKGASINNEEYTTIVSLTTTNPEQQVVQKAKYPTLEKTESDASVQVGQVVNYVLTGEIPNTSGFKSYEYTVNDTFTDGLTLDKSSIKVYISNSTTPLDVAYLTINTNEAAETGGGSFYITIDVMSIVNNGVGNVGDSITIKYDAKVNSKAVSVVSNNSATLTYSDSPKNSESKTTTPPDEEKVYSAKINVLKVDGNDTTNKLSGAKFVLKCTAVSDQDTEQTATSNGTAARAEAGKYYSVDADGTVSWIEISDLTAVNNISESAIKETTTNGTISFEGLENGTYELYEVTAPDGYNKIDGVAATVTINGNNDTTLTDLTHEETVKNNSGSVLPSTGGIGTTIFYVVGAVLVVGAGILLVTRKRMNA
jgi:fimbrial isopeptide formation D2 family protein/LPXTG-motif cell wall-anchored protein